MCVTCKGPFGDHHEPEHAVKNGLCVFQREDEMAKETEMKIDVVNVNDELKKLAVQYVELHTAHAAAHAAYLAASKEVNYINTKRSTVINKMKPLFSGDEARSLVVGDVVISNIGGDFYITTLVK